MNPGPGVLIPLVFGAGLATGLLRFWAPACILALLWALVVRRAPARLLAAVLALGTLMGVTTRALDAHSCAARMREGRVEAIVHSSDAASGRGLVRLRLVGGGCIGPVDARWPAGTRVPAGVTGRASGRWVARPGTAGRPGGTFIVSRLDTMAFEPGPAERMRNGIVSSAERLYGTRAPLVQALVLGTRGTLDREMRDAFAHAGLVHLLSISGFHVGLLSAWVVLVLRLLGASRARAFAVGAVVGVAYVAFLGWPAPGTRAAALTAVLAHLFHRQRRVGANALLAETCLLVMLVAPWSVFDLGGWLSAAALWGATTATRWSDRAFGEGFLARTIASSVGATLATAPITAATLGAVALAGIGLNIVAIPTAAVAVPGVGASLLAAQLWDGLAAALAAGSGLALHFLELMAEVGERIPGGHYITPAEPAAALPWLALLGAGLWIAGQRNTRREASRRLLLLTTFTAWFSLAAAVRRPSADEGRALALHFLDVGQGDGAAVRTPGGQWVVIDAGPKSGGTDAGRRVLVPFLARHRVRQLSAVIISHAHLDHLGGAEAVLERFGAGIVIEPADQVADPAYTSLLGFLAAEGIAWRPARPGMEFALDGVRFRVLHPDTTWSEWGADVNEGSAVVRVDYGKFSALFAGDAGFSAEARMSGTVGAVDLLKVGHHGSRGSTGEAWLRELAPRAAVISVGRNTYGHPAPDLLERLEAHHAAIWRTDLEGAVSVKTDGRSMTIEGRRGSVTYPVD